MIGIIGNHQDTGFGTHLPKIVSNTRNLHRGCLRRFQLGTSQRGIKLTLSSTKLEPSQQATMKITGIADDLRKVRTKPRILMITNDPDHAKLIINIKH